MRVPDGRWHPRAIAGPGAKIGHVLTWAGIVPKWMPASGGPVLFVSVAAGGPPTDGSVFWYVTDESC